MLPACSITDRVRWASYAFRHHWLKRQAPRQMHQDVLHLLQDPASNARQLNAVLDALLAGDTRLRSIEAAAVAFHVNRTDDLLDFARQAHFDDVGWQGFQCLLRGNTDCTTSIAAESARKRKHKHFWKAISRHLESIGPIPEGSESCHVICTASIAGDINSSTVYAGLRMPQLHVVCDERLASILARTFPHIHFIPTRRHYHSIHSLRTSLRVARHFCRLPHPSICRVLDHHAYETLLEARHLATTYDLMLHARGLQSATQPAFYKPLPELQEEFAAMLPAGPKVGILWQSETKNPVRNTYGLPRECLDRILQQSKCTFVNLQYRTDINGYDNVINPGFDRMNDLERLLALISQLDLVISPITTTANFAAMSGTPVLLQVNGLLFNSMDLETGEDTLLPNTRYAHCRNHQDISRTTEKIISRINAI